MTPWLIDKIISITSNNRLRTQEFESGFMICVGVEIIKLLRLSLPHFDSNIYLPRRVLPHSINNLNSFIGKQNTKSVILTKEKAPLLSSWLIHNQNTLNEMQIDSSTHHSPQRLGIRLSTWNCHFIHSLAQDCLYHYAHYNLLSSLNFNYDNAAQP
jgi:hypothetical protein